MVLLGLLSWLTLRGADALRALALAVRDGQRPFYACKLQRTWEGKRTVATSVVDTNTASITAVVPRLTATFSAPPSLATSLSL
jgi:hypothetical protein